VSTVQALWSSQSEFDRHPQFGTTVTSAPTSGDDPRVISARASGAQATVSATSATRAAAPLKQFTSNAARERSMLHLRFMVPPRLASARARVSLGSMDDCGDGSTPHGCQRRPPRSTHHQLERSPRRANRLGTGGTEGYRDRIPLRTL